MSDDESVCKVPGWVQVGWEEVNNSGRQGDLYGNWVGRTEQQQRPQIHDLEDQAQHKGWFVFLTVVKIHIKFTINYF